jgi:hypothetical protein
MLFPLWSSSIHLKYIFLRIFLIVGFSHAAFHLQFVGLVITSPTAWRNLQANGTCVTTLIITLHQHPYESHKKYALYPQCKNDQDKEDDM